MARLFRRASKDSPDDKFSVVIPTLQRSHRLSRLLELYANHPTVGEVLLINNAPQRMVPTHSKIRILNQDENLYVNPSWNLGARASKERLLVLSNDDIEFPSTLLDEAHRFLVRHQAGMLGPHPQAFRGPALGQTRIRRSFNRTEGYGTLLFLHRDNYIPIPDDLLIWCGDDWLWTRQSRKNYHMMGVHIETEMSTTSGSPEFQQIKDRDISTYESLYDRRGAMHIDRLAYTAMRHLRANTALRHLRWTGQPRPH